MSNQETQTVNPNAPAYLAYQVSVGKRSTNWLKIGAAWPHKDGRGFDLKLECTPYTGRVTLRTNEK